MSHCARCGIEFSCAVADCPADTPCWCMQVPPLAAAALEDVSKSNRDGQAASCLCRDCLLAALPPMPR